ncbi:MAG TPA: hypothetical protein VLG17_11355 [Pseudomonas sp.]|uniref:hypothetical protein n=1 Tax=Pseudomonas sp. TaxID=306 RepID=UPI002B58B5B1|nr:hypothetical protein [Pseudomonas sp.]HSX88582.1 hypothetical protein [Pseudomonas sp.]
MLVKFHVEDGQADLLMQHTGQRVASKAFLLASLSAPGLAVELQDARQEIARLRRIIDRQQQVLEGARSAASLLLEVAGQGDLFMEKVPSPPPSSSRPAPSTPKIGTKMPRHTPARTLGELFGAPKIRPPQ